MSIYNFPKSGSSLSTDYCIVGAGMVGLIAAKTLLSQGLSVVLVDSGYQKFNRTVQDLNSGFSGPFGNWPYPNFPVSNQRIRALGGTSMIWGGWCREMNDWDFTANEQCDISWPFSFDELKPFYKEARKALGIIEDEVITNAFPPEPLAPLITSSINCASETFREELLNSLLKEKNFTLITGCTLISLPTNKDVVSSATFRNSVGLNHDKSLTVKASRFFLCGGGIENARLLLALLPKSIIDGLPVGLGFMEHPKVLVGRFYPSNEVVVNYLKSLSPPLTGRNFFFKSGNRPPEAQMRGLFDRYFKQLDRILLLRFGELQLPYKLQKINGLGNAMLGLRETNIYDAASLVSLRYNLLTRNLFSCGPIGPSRFISLAREASAVIFGELAQRIRIVRPSFFVHIQCEQYPNDFNFISLTDIKDAQGIPRARLNWKMSEEDIQTVIGTTNEFQKIINKNKIGRFLPENRLIDKKQQMKYLEMNAHAAGHHMGTTRMGNNEQSSVCDSIGKVWRVKNLFVLGASLFPRSGAANPGLTSIALTLRNLKKIIETH